MLKGTHQNIDAPLQRNSWGEVLFVFYLTGEVLVGSFGDLAKGNFDKGHFSYQKNKEELTIHINAEKWKFKLHAVREDKLELQTLSGSYLAPYMQLVPLPIPN
jgi:ribosomal 30S subunit maturation factor RimM